MYTLRLLSLSAFISLGIFNQTISNADEVPLIPRTTLFGNYEKGYARISPDGTRLSYCAPNNGVLNIWVMTLGKEDDKPVTKETNRGVFAHYWAHNSKQILYEQDLNGDENYHVFTVDLESGDIRDCTTFPKVKAEVIGLNKHFPNEALIMMNKENPALFDAYHLDLLSGALTLVAKNPGTVVRWFADTQLQIRAAVATNTDGTQTLLARDHADAAWRSLLNVGFEDTLKDELYCGVLGFSRDGTRLYLNSSLGNNTRSLISVNLTTGERETKATDNTYDLTSVIFDADYEPAILLWQKDRMAYKVMNDALREDFKRMRAISAGDLNYLDKSADGLKWVLGFVHDNRSYEYYLYDRTTSTIHIFILCATAH